jgi:hypothetical protein
MPHSVTIRVQALRGGRPLSGFEVFVQANRQAPRVRLGTTLPNGTLTAELEKGSWLISVKTKAPINDLRRNVLDPAREILVPLPRMVLMQVDVLDAGADCLAITKRLKKNIAKNQYLRAKALIGRVKTSYANYRSIPQLEIFARLEDHFIQVSTGQKPTTPLDEITIPRTLWQKAGLVIRDKK